MSEQPETPVTKKMKLNCSENPDNQRTTKLFFSKSDKSETKLTKQVKLKEKIRLEEQVKLQEQENLPVFAKNYKMMS